MTNVVNVRFIGKRGGPEGREYAYFSPFRVHVGDLVDVKTERGIAQASVTQVNVPRAEIERFGRRAKAINGKSKLETAPPVREEPADGQQLSFMPQRPVGPWG